ncbi:MAG: hypothetical protein QOF45_1400, partial [Gaiellaceae bacterium]|nr:hypothetical protein [Gaiellaceae bacterium]
PADPRNQPKGLWTGPQPIATTDDR